MSIPSSRPKNKLWGIDMLPRHVDRISSDYKKRYISRFINRYNHSFDNPKIFILLYLNLPVNVWLINLFHINLFQIHYLCKLIYLNFVYANKEAKENPLYCSSKCYSFTVFQHVVIGTISFVNISWDRYCVNFICYLNYI